VNARRTRVELAGQLLRVLERWQRVGFPDIVIGDESWFLQYYNHRQIWLRSADEVPIRVARPTSAPKTMFIVFLNIYGVIFID
jgi:hypothetical protein